MSPRLLCPRTGGFHPEASDWRTRVIANGGSVSGSTLKAVSDFCKAIDKAGIRDRFYRLNLFCGNADSALNAVRTPLYRAQSFTASPLGNATDENTGTFVQGDYAENNGLLGNGSTKYLSTGLPMTFLGSNQVHLFASFVPDASANFRVLLGARANLSGSLAMEQNFNGTTSNRPRIAIFSVGFNPSGNASPITGRTQYLCQLDGTNGIIGESFARNVSIGQNTFGAYSATNTTAFLIFAGNQVGTGIAAYFHSRIDSYSIGAAFTTSAGRTAYHDALTTFRDALGRT
jgi:hypothetical protein